MPSPVAALQQIGGKIFLNLRFGFGIASAFDRDDIDVQECIDGQNFDLSLDKESFRNRKAFDLVATVPNGQEIRGFGELIKSDGSVSNLVQGGGVVYDWNGKTTFTEVGTVNASSRLRGGRHSTSLLDDKVILTDLEKKTIIKTWDGTTFEDLAHDLGGDLFAKYCIFRNERAFYFNVKSGSTDTPHVMLGSARGASIGVSDFASLSVANRPGTGRSDGDPFFIPMPDLKPINGVDRQRADTKTNIGTGSIIISTQEGSLWKLSGETPKITEAARGSAFKMEEFYANSAASGVESLTSMGKDVIYGRQAAIESAISAGVFGDTDADDASRWIKDQIEGAKSWTVKYNPQNRRAYWWAENGNEVWVFHKSMYEPSLKTISASTVAAVAPSGKLSRSPWSRWKTDFGNGDFRQTAAALMRRVTDKKDVIFFGDSSGRILQMEGTGLQDGGNDDIVVDRTSGTIRLPTGNVFDIKGNVKYRRFAGATLTLTFLFGGETVFNDTRTITIPAPTNISVYNASSGDTKAFYGGTTAAGTASYYGVEFSDRFFLQGFGAPGAATHLEVKAAVTGAEHEISEIAIEITPVP